MPNSSTVTEAVAGRVFIPDAEALRKIAETEKTTVSLVLKRIVHQALQGETTRAELEAVISEQELGLSLLEAWSDTELSEDRPDGLWLSELDDALGAVRNAQRKLLNVLKE